MFKTSWTACIGVALATTAASAADLPSRRAPPAYVAPIALPYSWTGVEFGLVTSYTFPRNQNAFTTPFGGAAPQPSPVSLNKSAFSDVGGGLAANYQLKAGSGVVLGAKFDIDYFNLHAYEDVFTPTGKINDQERLGYLGTANGRIGYAFDRILVYGTGGFAFGQIHTSTNVLIGGTSAYTGTYNGNKNGYDYGGGVEYAIPPSSFLNYLSVEKLLGIDKKLGLDIFEGTVRAEYIHYHLGGDPVAVNSVGGPGSYVSTFKTQGDLIRVGLGYKFSGTPTPVVARY